MGKPSSDDVQKAKAVMRGLRDHHDGQYRGLLERLGEFMPHAADFAWLDENDPTLGQCFTSEAGGWLEPGEDAEFWSDVASANASEEGGEPPSGLIAFLQGLVGRWEAAAAAPAQADPAMPVGGGAGGQRFQQVEPVQGGEYPGWWQGYDSVDGVWKYVHGGSEPPGDQTPGWAIGEVAFAATPADPHGHAATGDAQAPAARAYENTDGWNHSRTPGTFYYRYLERDGAQVYVYNDKADAADQEWHELKYWDDAAQAEARKPENKLTAKFPDWGSSWAAWSVLDSPQAEGGRVYGKADEGRWYDYNGAVEAHNSEPRGHAPQESEAAAAASPLTQAAQEIHEEILPQLAEEVMRDLPPEIAGKEGIDDLVRQLVQEEISRTMAESAGQ